MKTKTKYKDGGKKGEVKKILTAPKPSFAPKDPFFKQTTSKVGSGTKSASVKGKPVPAKKKPTPQSKPVVKKSTGPTVKSEWESKTGTPWKEAKERGLTDGSKSQNMRIMKDLKSGENFKLGSKAKPDTGKGTYEGYKERTSSSRLTLKNGGVKKSTPKKYKTGGVKKAAPKKLK